MGLQRRTGGLEGWDCYALPAAGRDGIATPYWRRGGMGLQRPTGGGEGWDCNALGIATPYRRRGGMGLLPFTGGGEGWDCNALGIATPPIPNDKHSNKQDARQSCLMLCSLHKIETVITGRRVGVTCQRR